MNLDGEHSNLRVLGDLVLVLACVGAVVLSFALTRKSVTPEDTAGTATPHHAQAALGASAVADRSTTTTTPASSTMTSPASATTPPAATSLSAVAESCRLANLRQQAPLSAADVSLAQFDKHIDAMNLLVAGKISLAVATTFWDETRVGATQNIAAFHRADRDYLASKSRCPDLDRAVADTGPYGQVVAVKGCASAIDHRAVALARARTAVATWEHHVHDMEMLRMGHLTPAQATAAWRKNWHTGQRQLHAYDLAAAKARKVHCSLD